MVEPHRLWIFLLFGIAASILLALGLLIMKSRGAALPTAHGAQTLYAILRWIRDPMWLVGLGVQTLGYALYMLALAEAPVSVLAVTMQGGIALFVIFAAVFLGERADVREWLGIIGVIVSMVLLALSLQGEAAQGTTDESALVLLTVGAIIITALPWSRTQLRLTGAAPAIASGIAFGLGSLYAKALADAFADAPNLATAIPILATPWLPLTIGANLVGLVLLQNSFHWTRGIIAMPLSSACSNIVPIIGGMVAFGERLPADRFSATMRLSAFGLTVIASALLAVAKDEAHA